MKIGFVAITAAIALAATSLIGTAVAGIGPSRGLPSVNVAATSTVQDMYAVNATAVPGINGSVMCVACHTRNPAKRTATNTGAQANLYVGTHFVTANFGDTSPGGGYTDTAPGQKLRSTRTTAVYMATPANLTTFALDGFMARPNYGLGTGTAINANTQDPTTGSPQMICESCHDLVRNQGAAKLLARAFANGADNTDYTIGQSQLTGHTAAGGQRAATLCRGCHGNMSAGVNAEWQYHPLYGGGSWAGTHHHRNSDGTGSVAYYGAGTQTAGHAMGSVDRTFYPAAGAANALQMWGAAYGELGAAGRALTYQSTNNKKMRNNVLTAAQGQLRVAVDGQVLCTNCHRGHNGQTSAGASILMATASGGANNIGSATTANAFNGMGILGRDTLLVNTNPLCLGCHQ
jgi:hypothetical protein